MNTSPVLISVYNRFNHFKKCIESLKQNKLALDTHLFIAIDAPYRKEDVVINGEIINYAKNITGFKKITLFIREKNFGARNNGKVAIDDVFLKYGYDRIIRTEDDNIFSRDFLSFINKALEFYKEDKKIFSICGYNYPVNLRGFNKKIYFSNLFSAWGFGIWRDRYQEINWDQEEIHRNTRLFLKNYKKVYKYNKIANNLVLNLIYMIKKNTVYGDGYISLYQYLNGLYSVFPVVSRVRNIGHDNSGEHCKKKKKNEIFSNQELYDGESDYSFPVEVREDKNVNSLLKRYFKRNLIKNIYTFVILVLFNFNILYKKK